MKINSRTYLLLLLYLFPIYGFSQPADSSIVKARAVIEAFIERNQVPGLSISVSIKGDMVWSEGFGYADLEHKIPVMPGKTKFRIGSVSKPVTASGIALLYQRGTISLDDTIQKYVPCCPHVVHCRLSPPFQKSEVL